MVDTTLSSNAMAFRSRLGRGGGGGVLTSSYLMQYGILRLARSTLDYSYMIPHRCTIACPQRIVHYIDSISLTIIGERDWDFDITLIGIVFTRLQ